MYRYWFMNQNNLSIIKKVQLINAFGTAENLYYASQSDLEALQILSDKELNFLLDSQKSWELEEEWIKFQEMGISLVTLEDQKYPNRLRELSDPPYGLFVKGNLPEENKLSVSIVGARQRSAYGETLAQEISYELGANQIQVISGMARGIDSDAHKGCIKGEGQTFAVLGCGVDVIYPSSNKFLYQQILESGGGIISEFPIGRQALRINFPQRNRIISGLSDIVVVIEAREKSGSLITAEFALEQGKDIYALPGRITDELSRGCNSLIHEGSGVILSAKDLLKDIGIREKSSCQKASCTKNVLEKEELLLYSLIDFTPRGIGYLLQNTSFSFLNLMDLIEKMKLKGLIKEQPSNFFVRAKTISN